MARMEKRSLSLLLNSVYPIVLIGANLTASFSIDFLDPLIHTEADLELLGQAFKGFQTTTFLSILVPTVLCIIYSLPISQTGSNAQVDRPSALAKRRLLNAPLVLSLLSGTGWLMAISTILYACPADDWGCWSRMSRTKGLEPRCTWP